MKVRELVFSLIAKASLGVVLSVLLGPLLASSAWAQPTQIFVSGKDRPYRLLRSEKPTLVTVRGPGELRIVTRARFRPRSDNDASYSLRLRINGAEPFDVRFAGVQRSRTAMFRDGTLGVPGRLMDYRLQLRRGFHNIEIQPGPGSPPIYYRTLFEKGKPQRRDWITVTPAASSEEVELVIRESLVTYHRNSPQQPFQLDLIGPTELRIFTRLENSPEMRGRVHYRLQVRIDGEVVNTFQLSSRRSDLATYRDEDSLVPGRAAEIVLPIPAGAHRLEIHSLDPDKSTLLARFMLPKEDLGLTVP
ncbi:MAG: hypothetical protein AAGD01_03135 [Acidobacteriota bacterium]